MKKVMFALALVFSVTCTFAAQQVQATEPSFTKEPELPCIRCAVCGEILFCVIAFDCEVAMTQLHLILDQNGCGQPNSTETLGN